MVIKKEKFASLIDHSILHPGQKKKEIIKELKIAKKYGMQVCTYSCNLMLARKILGKKTKLSAVVSFPHGCDSTSSKVKQALDAIKLGANEIDMVANYGLLLSGEKEKYKKDIEEVARMLKGRKKVLKVIIETSELNKKQKIFAVKTIKDISRKYRIKMFVKTSTGRTSKGASVADMKLIRYVLGKDSDVGIKASGYIRTYKQCLSLMEASKSEMNNNFFRIGTSKSLKIIKEIGES